MFSEFNITDLSTRATYLEYILNIATHFVYIHLLNHI